MINKWLCDIIYYMKKTLNTLATFIFSLIMFFFAYVMYFYNAFGDSLIYKIAGIIFIVLGVGLLISLFSNSAKKPQA